MNPRPYREPGEGLRSGRQQLRWRSPDQNLVVPMKATLSLHGTPSVAAAVLSTLAVNRISNLASPIFFGHAVFLVGRGGPGGWGRGLGGKGQGRGGEREPEKT